MIEFDVELGPVKRCPKCGEWWPADREFFYAKKDTASGLQSWCRACWSEWAASSPKRRAYGREWHARRRAALDERRKAAQA